MFGLQKIVDPSLPTRAVTVPAHIAVDRGRSRSRGRVGGGDDAVGMPGRRDSVSGSKPAKHFMSDVFKYMEVIFLTFLPLSLSLTLSHSRYPSLTYNHPRTYIHRYIHRYTHTCIHICTYIHAYIHTHTHR